MTLSPSFFKLQPLVESRFLLDELIKEHAELDALRTGVFKGCRFKPKRIKLDHDKLHTNAHFESGVCKIQNGEELTADEAEACESLLLDGGNDDVEGGEEEEPRRDEPYVNVAERHRRKKEERAAARAAKADGDQTGYGNVDFILGSAAEVERLWSLCKHILTNIRKGQMECDTFEALIYLKCNMRHWRLSDVMTADMNRVIVPDEDELENDGGDIDDDEW